MCENLVECAECFKRVKESEAYFDSNGIGFCNVYCYHLFNKKVNI